MTPTPEDSASDGVHRPRTITPGLSNRPVTVVRPRTVGALGRPDPIVSHPLRSNAGGPGPSAVAVAVAVAEPGVDPDAGIWVDDVDVDVDDQDKEEEGGNEKEGGDEDQDGDDADADADDEIDDEKDDEHEHEDEGGNDADGAAPSVSDVARPTGSTGPAPDRPAPGLDPDAPRRTDPAADAPETDDTGLVDRAAEAAGPPRMLRNNLLVASGTLTSRITGLVRTSLVFALLIEGLSDVYLSANNTPNMIYELILGGVLTATLVPLFTDDLEQGRKGDATSAIISFAIVALLVVALLAAVVSPLLILLLSTGSPRANRTDYISAGVPLALLFAPQVFFYGLMAVWSAALNARHRFLAAAWTPVLNNLIAIATLVAVFVMVDGKPTLADALADRSILLVLGIGTTAGIVVMAMALYPSIRRSGVDFHFRFDLKHPAVRRAVRLSGWTFGYVVANQIALVIITILSKPGSGGSTQYQTAFQFFHLPHGLLAVSIMVTFEPLLGRADARGDRSGFNAQLLLGFRLIGLLVIPAAVAYVALPKGLEYRTFTATGDLDRAFGVTAVIAAFALGLPGFSSYIYVLRAFYAMKNTRTPFLINGFENVIRIVAAVVLVRFYGVVGLALAFALAYSVAAVTATVLLTRHSPGFDWRALVRTWVELLVAAALMGGLVFGTVVAISPGSVLMVFPTVAASIVVGAVVYVVTISVLRVEGISELFARLPGLRRFT